MSDASKRFIALIFALTLALGVAASRLMAANGDLLATSTSLQGKNVSGVCPDSDGTFWAAPESTSRIEHLDASLSRIGDIANPHGKGVFPNLILTRGIAFRPGSQTLLVLAKDGGAFKLREVDRSGAEKGTGPVTIDTSTFTNANFYGLAYDPMLDQVWVIDDNNDRLVRVGMNGVPIKTIPFPFDEPAYTLLRGVGISFRQEGAIPFLYFTYGDIFTLGPSKIIEMTINGQMTGFEVPLDNLPGPEAGGILATTFSGKDAVIVVGKNGLFHVLERTRSNPLPPTFLKGRVTRTNQLILSWLNHGSGVGGAYLGGIAIGKNRLPFANITGTLLQYPDDDPLGPTHPAEGTAVVNYTLKGSNGAAFSPAQSIDVVAGKGGLITWKPFEGREPYDIAQNYKNGELYVTDSAAGEIYWLNSELNLKGKLPSPFLHPGGIAFNAEGDDGKGSLLVATSEGVLVREVDLFGNPLDLQIPVDLRPVTNPRIGGLVYDPTVKLYTCVETTSRQLVSFDRNGQQRAACSPPEIFTKKLSEGIALDHYSGNFHAVFEDRTVRELFSNCTPTSFSFELNALGEALPEWGASVRGIEVQNNTLLVCGHKQNAIFQVLISPQGGAFVRGDLDRDNTITITDAVLVAEYLFRAGPSPICLDAADTNDDGEIDVSDPVYLLFFQFLGGPQPPAPFPTADTDPTYLDNLEC